MSATTEIILTLFGGLALFIFGMNMMSDGLQQAAGNKMKNILGFLTKNPIMGVLAGALTTAVLQSSSATTVMVIGFVSAGLMKLPQAISVIMGANIGTTMTAQLIAFKIGDYAWLFVIAGFILFFFLKKHARIANLGQTIFGFGLLFVGINIMGDTMKPLAASQFFADIMLSVHDVPVLGVLIGTVMTVVVQSSSATIAVLQNMASQAASDGVSSIIGLQGALPILFGDNIGTTITAILASIGASVNAKRAAVAHTIFNVLGTLVFIWFIPQFAALVEFISPSGTEVDVIARQIANAHSFFNILNTLIWLPLIFVLVKIVTKLVPGKEVEKLPSEPLYLDYKIIEQPVFSIHLAKQELTRLVHFTADMIEDAKAAFLKEESDILRKVYDREEVVNNLEGEIAKYLSTIFSVDSLTEKQASEVTGLIHVAQDIEHIGDSCTNITEFVELKIKNGYDFSEDAKEEISFSFDQISEMVRNTILSLETGDADTANLVLKQEDEVNENEARLRKHHMVRIGKGLCSPEFTVIYTDILHNIEKIGDACTNIAEAVLDDINFKKNII